MTDDQIRHKTVAIAVIYDPQHGFLLWNNKRWGGYAFPMKHMEDGDDPAQTALQAISDRDFPLDLPDASAGGLEEAGWFGFSEGVKEETYYDYHVLEVNPGQPLNPVDLDPDIRFFTYAQLQAAANGTEPTRAIAKSIVEEQEVVVALISRERSGELEFLLIGNRNYGYFFPSIRRKTHGSLESLAEQSVRFDLAYDGAVMAKYCGEVPHVRLGTRFGASQRRYRFYLCCVCIDECDRLEESLNAFQSAKGTSGEAFGERGYWDWFTANEMKTRQDVSPDAKVLLLDAIECAK